MDLKDGLFWILVNVCIGLTGIMMLLYLFKLTNIAQKYPENYYLKGLKSISDSILHIFASILFVPIVQIFLEVFV